MNKKISRKKFICSTELRKKIRRRGEDPQLLTKNEEDSVKKPQVIDTRLTKISPNVRGLDQGAVWIRGCRRAVWRDEVYDIICGFPVRLKHRPALRLKHGPTLVSELLYKPFKGCNMVVGSGKVVRISQGSCASKTMLQIYDNLCTNIGVIGTSMDKGSRSEENIWSDGLPETDIRSVYTCSTKRTWLLELKTRRDCIQTVYSHDFSHAATIVLQSSNNQSSKRRKSSLPHRRFSSQASSSFVSGEDQVLYQASSSLSSGENQLKGGEFCCSLRQQSKLYIRRQSILH
ncbi:hypothetical protein Tco_1004942 [Tanacetum coccineum]|uniref:Uncharacterized protein n=1 Tax=Tanacetum coccineum TaxID=301880 RepID=A0ABQ5FE24_9ASTR